MEMKILKSEKRLCTCCMEEHEVKTVQIKERTTFKNRVVSYVASYSYCDVADELYMEEVQMQENDVKMKDAYRKAEGILTSAEISSIRDKYGITQGDLCSLLGWGAKTITRYESHQVQDKAHDTILKKLDRDPEWFIALLKDARDNLTQEAYHKYLDAATESYEADKDLYLRRAIEANYAGFSRNRFYQGNIELSLDRVVDVIRYFSASSKVTCLYKAKLMKLMWYADALSYKERGMAITGLAYQALPMGAVPVGHNVIVDLKDVPCEEEDVGENVAYHFSLQKAVDFPSLSMEDKAVLDIVIEKLGKMTKDEIVSFMHKEQAYISTAPRDIISFQYAKNLQI